MTESTAEVQEFITLEDAAKLVGKTQSNISYLVQYNRLRKFDARGRPVRRAANGGLRVSRSELLGYVESWNRRVKSRLEKLKIEDTSIAFLDVPERERTKHVHRLHPYLGKFIPQLVGYFLARHFEPGQLVLDPFCGCYDEETQFLTRRGWVFGRDLNPDDQVGSLEAGELRFVNPTRLYKYRYNGKMFRFTGKHLDLFVTPNHRMVVIDRYSKRVREKLPSEVLTGDQIMRSAGWSGTMFDFYLPECDVVVPEYLRGGKTIGGYTKHQTSIPIPMGSWMAFLGWYLAEGSLNKSSGRVVEISQTRKIAEVESVLDALPFKYGYAGHKFRIYSKQLLEFLKPLGGKYSKYIPPEVKNLPAPYLRILLNSLILGDGHPRADGGFTYYTSSKRLADDVAEIAFKCGFGVQTGVHKPSSGYINGRKIRSLVDNYVVYGSLKHQTPKITKKPSQVDYDGWVYCCEVPSHVLLVRRNGRVVWCGNSGTTLVEASERGVDSVGIDISEFNVMIARVKLADYKVPVVEKEVADVSKRTAEFSERKFSHGQGPLRPPREGGYLETWFAPRSLAEMLYFRSILPEYEHQDLLKVLLSRTARSCRLVHHYDLATPDRPVRGPYRCYKHKGKTCSPVTSILPRLRFYSADTVRRVSEFQRVRKAVSSCVVEGDSRTIELADHLRSVEGLEGRKVDGVFTSPPYVGQIDYHEQHRYAYELFGIARRDELEIGPKARGKSERAKSDYAKGLVESLLNVGREMKPGAKVLLVANDRWGLYPEIFEEAGMSLEKRFERPVEDRTERDKRPYSETVFLAKLGR